MSEITFSKIMSKHMKKERGQEKIAFNPLGPLITHLLGNQITKKMLGKRGKQHLLDKAYQGMTGAPVSPINESLFQGSRGFFPEPAQMADQFYDIGKKIRSSRQGLNEPSDYEIEYLKKMLRDKFTTDGLTDGATERAKTLSREIGEAIDEWKPRKSGISENSKSYKAIRKILPSIGYGANIVTGDPLTPMLNASKEILTLSPEKASKIYGLPKIQEMLNKSFLKQPIDSARDAAIRGEKEKVFSMKNKLFSNIVNPVVGDMREISFSKALADKKKPLIDK